MKRYEFFCCTIFYNLSYIKDGKANEKDFIEGIGSGAPLRVGGRGFDE